MVGLADEVGAHGDVTGVAKGLPVGCGPVVIYEVLDLLDGHLTDEQVLVVVKDRLEAPPSHLEREGVDQEIFLVVGLSVLAPLPGVEEVVL